MTAAQPVTRITWINCCGDGVTADAAISITNATSSAIARRH